MAGGQVKQPRNAGAFKCAISRGACVEAQDTAQKLAKGEPDMPGLHKDRFEAGDVIGPTSMTLAVGD
jgi:hypothetical protein